MSYSYTTKKPIQLYNLNFNPSGTIPKNYVIEVSGTYVKHNSISYYKLLAAFISNDHFYDISNDTISGDVIGKYIAGPYLNDSSYVSANNIDTSNKSPSIDYYTINNNLYPYVKDSYGNYITDRTKNLSGTIIGIQSNNPTTITVGGNKVTAYKIKTAQKTNGSSVSSYVGLYVGSGILNEGGNTTGKYVNYNNSADTVKYTVAKTVTVNSLQVYSSVIVEENNGNRVVKAGNKSKYTLTSGDIIEGVPLSYDNNFILIKNIALGKNSNLSASDKANIIGGYVIAYDGPSSIKTLDDTTMDDVENSDDDTSSISALLTAKTIAAMEEVANGILNGTLNDYAETVYTSDEFLIDYEINEYSSTEDYINGLSETSLKITSLRSIFGSPHQFLPNTDARITSSEDTGGLDDIGRLYGEKILKNMPILFITPGTPDFLAGFSKKQQETLLSKIIGHVAGNADDDLNMLINSNGGRYYSLKFDYTSYFKYVNPMLRSAAIFLGIGDKTINGVKLSEANWMLESTGEQNGSSDLVNNAITDVIDSLKASVGNFLGLQQLLGQHYGCLAFYADCGNQVDDSFSNSTTQSSIMSSLNSLSDYAREMNFLVGTVGSNLGLELDELIGKNIFDDGITATTDFVDKALGKNNIISNILNKGKTILSGGRMLFPEIWADSSFSRSYSARMKLISPSGDKLSIFLNILVPLYHLLALVLPRQGANPEGYFSPFLIRAYSKGLFNIDMGIITDLNITKGAEAEWTIDGIPTVAEVSFTIKDLYDGMSMSTSEEIGKLNILSNTAELDYIANSCGMNINDQDVMRTIKMACMLGYGSLKDKVEIDIFGGAAQWWDQKMQNIFGRF